MKLLELQILYAIQDYSVYKTLKGLISKDIFSSEETKLIFNCIEFVAEKYQRSADYSEIKTLIYEKVTDSEKKQTYRRILRRMQEAVIEEDLLSDLIKKAKMKSSMRRIIQDDIIPSLDSSDPLPMDLIKQKIMGLDPEEIGGEYYDYANLQEREHFNESESIATGIPQLDRALKGGLYPGELGLLSGSPEDGKTLLAVNFAIPSLVEGSKVYFFTLDETDEQIAKRFDVRITGKTGEELRTEFPKLPTWISFLYIVDKSSGCKMNDITGFIQRHGTPGLIIIDGGDLLIPDMKRKERRFELGEIYDGYLRLCRQFKTRVWVTTQSTARSSDSVTKKLTDLAEAKLEKSKVASAILMIIKTDDPDVLRLQFRKLRRPPGIRTCFVDIDRARQMVKGEIKHDP